MTPQEEVSNGVLLERIENLIKGQDDLIQLHRCHVDAQELFERDTEKYRERQTGVNENTKQRLNNHEKEIQDLRVEVDKLTRAIQPLIFTNRILSILGGLLMTSVMGLIWAIITHNVMLVFPP
jgi:hypothetical protein